MTQQTFILNGQVTTIDVNSDVRVLWVLRDLLGVTGPKYGCGINVCKACTSHINGRAFNPCSVKVGDLKPKDRIDTIEGLPATVGQPLHPMQQAWIDRDVAQCGYCQPGQIMAAVALVKKVRREGRQLEESDLDNIRNICRCGTYVRIREAIEQGARGMQFDDSVPPPVAAGTLPVGTLPPGSGVAGLPVPAAPTKKQHKHKRKHHKLHEGPGSKAKGAGKKGKKGKKGTKGSKKGPKKGPGRGREVGVS